METLLLDNSEKQLELAAELIKNGELVGIPTETVYGLGADASNEEAVAANTKRFSQGNRKFLLRFHGKAERLRLRHNQAWHSCGRELHRCNCVRLHRRE